MLELEFVKGGWGKGWQEVPEISTHSFLLNKFVVVVVVVVTF